MAKATTKTAATKRNTLTAQATKAAAERAKKAAYERQRRAKKRAVAPALSGEALHHALQDPVNQASAPPTPERLISQGMTLLQNELHEAQRALDATQAELTRVVNVGFTGTQLLLMVRDLHEMLDTLQSCGVSLPQRHRVDALRD